MYQRRFNVVTTLYQRQNDVVRLLGLNILPTKVTIFRVNQARKQTHFNDTTSFQRYRIVTNLTESLQRCVRTELTYTEPIFEYFNEL